MDYSSFPRAPRGGGRAFAVTELCTVFGEDVLDHPQERGFGECDAETMQQLRRVRDNPGATVRIYRALPAGLSRINRGDWVTLSRDYARQYAMRDDVAANDWPVLEAEVPAAAVFTDGVDLDGYGYDGPSLKGLQDRDVDGNATGRSAHGDSEEPEADDDGTQGS